MFTPGLELSRAFFAEIVRPLLVDRFPELRYGAALLGSGSEILGFDTEMSTDHNWGPRVDLFFEVNADGTDDRPIAGGLPNPFDLAWVPAGDTLYFVVEGPSPDIQLRWDIYVVRADGSARGEVVFSFQAVCGSRSSCGFRSSCRFRASCGFRRLRGLLWLAQESIRSSLVDQHR